MTSPKDNLIVFDWNGTILADTTACLKATNTVLSKMGLPHATIAQYRNHYTMPINKLYNALGASQELIDNHGHVIHPLWHEIYSAATIRLRRGAKAMLAGLRPLRCDNVILSNYLTHRIDEQARKLDVREHFDHIIAFDTGDAVTRRLRKGERLKEHLEEHPSRSGIIIGDSEEEIEIGHELGLTTIAITDGMCSTARLRAMKPDFLIRSLSEIAPIAHRAFGHEAEVA